MRQCLRQAERPLPGSALARSAPRSAVTAAPSPHAQARCHCTPECRVSLFPGAPMPQEAPSTPALLPVGTGGPGEVPRG